MKPYRQGDVLLIPVAQAPQDARAVASADGRFVLAYGEATGHHHSVSATGTALLETDTNERFLQIMEGSGIALEHQEHDPIVLPQGVYRVVLQREHWPIGERRVAD